ncbi:MAG: hypothetical protein Q7S06_02095 [Nanoarchaeota archaeon]|nr:hypothetical protein [Nanoarchaeota archaeon]
MRRTLGNIVLSGLIAVGSLFLPGCDLLNKLINSTTNQASEAVTGETDAYKKAVRIANNPSSVFNAEVTKSIVSTQLAPQTEKVLVERDEEIYTAPKSSPLGKKYGEIPYVYEYNVKSGDLEIFINDGKVRRLTYRQGIDVFPSLSPNKERIAFTSKRDGKFALYVMDTNGEDIKRIRDEDPEKLKIYEWDDDQNIILERSAKEYTQRLYIGLNGKDYGMTDTYTRRINVDTGEIDFMIRVFLKGKKVRENGLIVDPEYKKFDQ